MRRRHAALPNSKRIEHDAEKCQGISDNIMLYFFYARADPDLRSFRPKIVRLQCRINLLFLHGEDHGDR
ncbi:hypothetical protein DQ393_14815 [Rhizobium tropici]|uniref:Uncharacterized protein n=1 Tax=Rhizobium tropici TaxID=398 RepID=A0A329Y9L4_RHITR|nr:hypothetical protein DQ393_14815 [Rhizobium tropici]